MEQIMNYVKPELIVVAVALYFLGMALKQAQAVKDKYIPLIIGGVSYCVPSGCWLPARSEPASRRRWQSLQRSRRASLWRG